MEAPAGRPVSEILRVAGAALASAALFLFCGFLGLGFLSGIPCARLRLTSGARAGWSAVVLAGVLVLVGVGSPIGMWLGSTAGTFGGAALAYAMLGLVLIPAVLMAAWIDQGFRCEQSLLAAFGVALVLLAVGMGLYQLQRGVTPAADYRATMEPNIDLLVPMVKNTPGGRSMTEDEAREALEASLGLLERISFAVMAIWSLTGLTIGLSVLARSHRFGLPARLQGFDSRRVRVPQLLVIPFIICGLLTLVPVDAVRTWCYNILIILAFIYLLCGVSILHYLYARMRVPLVFKFVIYLVTAVFLLRPDFCLIVAGVGLFDHWFDFRKLRSAGDGPTTGEGRGGDGE